MQISEQILSRLQNEVSVSVHQLSALQAVLNELFQEEPKVLATTAGIEGDIVFREKSYRTRTRRPQAKMAPSDDLYSDIEITAK